MPRMWSTNARNWVLAPILILLVGYAFSINIGYVEGDDATSILYHMMGRDGTLQPPYASYHAFADVLLSLLPMDQDVLLLAGMIATAVANIVVYLCILALGFRWLKINTARAQTLIAVLMLFAIPELFYLGNVYTPALIAMACILSAHLLVLKAFEQESLSRHLGFALFAGFLFGVGAATRWDMVLYGGVIFVDLISSGYLLHKLRRLAFIRHSVFAALWGAFALICWVLVIYLSGYTINDIGNLISWSQNWRQALSLVTLATIQPLLSPFTIMTFVIGLVVLIHRRHSLLLVLMVSLLLVSPWIGTGIPKTMLSAVPALVAVCIIGIQSVYALPTVFMRRISLSVGFILILLPWVVGVRLQLGEGAWGPGFELQDYDYIESTPSFQFVFFQSGTAVPTSEGPRALFGHMGAIFGGGWRGFVQTQTNETAFIIDTALREKIPLVILRGSGSLYLSEIVSRGFTTTDPESEKRRLFLSSQDEIVIEVIRPSVNESFLADSSLPNHVIVIGYPSTLRALYLQAPQRMQKIASIAAIYSTASE